jgi:hypothetical protein
MSDDLSKILVPDNSTKKFTINYKDQDFNFEIRELSYTEVTEIQSRAVEFASGRAKINKAEYDIQYLESALVKAPWDNLKMTRKIMQRMKDDFGVLLSEHIQNPFAIVDDEVKNESSEQLIDQQKIQQ